MYSTFRSSLLLVYATFFGFSASAKYVPFLDPGFFFDYNIEGQAPALPITEQCERIHIKWDRSNARGPNPTAPYNLQIYTSTFLTPFIVPAGNGLSFDWDVPFSPGTQYQICMFDKNGVTGGCQAMYTVIKNSTTANPTCQNVTFPTFMNVIAVVDNGPASQFGVIDQCTDLSITPQTGTPPFTMLIAPSLHPPYKIVSNSMGPINWTVSLSWSFPFFVSLSSSDGLMWSNGPMHSGGFGPSDCLAPGSISLRKAKKVAVGAGVGGSIGGLALGMLLAFFVWFWEHRKTQKAIRPISLSSTMSERPLPDLPPEVWNPNTRFIASLRRLCPGGSITAPPPPTYVYHHDGGRVASVGGSSNSIDVVDLPPEYNDTRGVGPIRTRKS